jgi:hypothetical protein
VSDLQTLARAVAAGTRAALRRGMLVLEPQRGDWVNQNLWGDQRAQGVPAAVGVEVEVLPKNTKMYGPPHVHSVSLCRGDEIVAQNADVYASVTYGCGGIENNFLCDWLHGLQFSLVCNSLHVNALSYAPSALSAYNSVGAAIFLGAMVAKGTVSQGCQPVTKTEPFTEVVNGGVLSFPVPDFARAATVHVLIEPATLNSDPSVPTSVLVRFTAAGAAKLAQYDAQVCAGGKSIPIPGGATEIRILNSNAATVALTVQWFLGL